VRPAAEQPFLTSHAANLQRQAQKQDPRSLPRCPDFCPARPLRSGNSLASCRRNGSPFPTKFRAQVDFPECCEGSGYAVQFTLKSHAFLLELAHYGLDQILWHRAILSPAFGTSVWSDRGFAWRTHLSHTNWRYLLHPETLRLTDSQSAVHVVYFLRTLP
jgi:hypothetical protein